MTLDLSSFNDTQLAAVHWQDGPLVVLAGPGSGKTRVLTYRVARLIVDSTQARFRVLGVTFTNKAASEMRTRLDTLLPRDRDRALLTTFHSFAAEVLRQHGSHVGLRPDFAILAEQADREAVLADAIRVSRDPNGDFAPRPGQLMPVLNRLLDEVVSVDNVPAWLAQQPHGADITAIYREYRNQLRTQNRLDFPSLLAIAVDLLEKTPAIARQLQRIYRYVCVDEFQDTNSAQYRFLVQLIPAHQPNLFVVADDDQMIYGWNGASPNRLLELRDQFQMELMQLPENYRCPPEVVTLANNLIRHNDDRAPDKKEITARKAVGREHSVVVNKLVDFSDELDWLAQSLGTLGPDEWPNTVVLARRRKLLEELVAALTDKGIPAHIPIRKNEFESAPYRWLHAMLRLANARQDREQLRRASRAFFQLEGINIQTEDIAARAAVSGEGDVLRAWLDVAEERAGLDVGARRMLVIARSALLERLDFWKFVASAQEWFQVVQHSEIAQLDTAFAEYTDEVEIWRGLLQEIAEQSVLSDLSLHNFLQELDLRAKEKPAPKNAVRCMTIHGSKGLEFHNVYLMGLVEDELPSWAATKKGIDSRELKEERRNCFVAITRAEETLTLTLAGTYFGWPKQPSRFLSEMGLSVK